MPDSNDSNAGFSSGRRWMGALNATLSALAALAPVIEDLSPGLGPLGGICSALASTAARRAVFLAVDLPLVPASLVVFLMRHARITGSAVTVPSVNGFAQTFPAVLDRAVLPVLEGELEAGRRGCFSGFQAAAAGLGGLVNVIPVEMVVQSGHVAHPDGMPAARWFLNVNAPEALRLAHEFGGHADRVS